MKLLQNTHNEKQAGCICNEYVVSKLLDIGSKKSNVDEGVFFYEGITFILHTDDGIFVDQHNYFIDI